MWLSGAVAALALAMALGCSRPPGPPDSSNISQSLPFDHSPGRPAESNPSLIPSNGLSEGTFLTIRLKKQLSSAAAHAGDGFQGDIDDPIVVDQQTLVSRGVQVNGRVLEAKASTGPYNPGYLRITLVSMNVGGRTIPIDTSSVFTKASARNDRPSPAGTATPPSNEVLFTPDRRLTFRLAQAVDLQ